MAEDVLSTRDLHFASCETPPWSRQMLAKPQQQYLQRLVQRGSSPQERTTPGHAPAAE